jgi:CspA family cold shock protein
MAPAGKRRATRKILVANGSADQNEASVYGTIKKIIKDKGFGFIIADDGGDEVFFHRSRLAPKTVFEDLREGNEVQFEVRSGEKGRQAFNLRLR